MTDATPKIIAAIRSHWIEGKAEKGFGYWPHRSPMTDVDFLLAVNAHYADALRRFEKILVEDTAAEEEQHCGWGPILADVRSVLGSAAR